jgi:hypothetical protein
MWITRAVDQRGSVVGRAGEGLVTALLSCRAQCLVVLSSVLVVMSSAVETRQLRLCGALWIHWKSFSTALEMTGFLKRFRSRSPCRAECLLSCRAYLLSCRACPLSCRAQSRQGNTPLMSSGSVFLVCARNDTHCNARNDTRCNARMTRTGKPDIRCVMSHSSVWLRANIRGSFFSLRHAHPGPYALFRS